MTFQDFSLERKTALVTGAGRGLGLEAARGLTAASYVTGHILAVDGGYLAHF